MTLREYNSPPNTLGIPVKSEYMAQYPDEAEVCRTFQTLQISSEISR
jgi:hypothetical protein